MFLSLRSPRNIMGNNVSATMCPRSWPALRPKQTTTHCCGHIVADTNVSSFARARNICCRHKFCVRDTDSVSDFVQKHFVSATNVSQFAQPKKHHGQQCVRNNVSSFTRAFKDVRANCFCAFLLRTTARANSHATSCIERARQVLKWIMIGQMAIAIALLGFNDLGRPLIPTFVSRNWLYLQLSPHCSKMNQKSMWEVKKFNKISVHGTWNPAILRLKGARDYGL